MTGFGNAEVCTKGTTISVQISSINRKQTEIRVLQPRELLHLEKGIRAKIKNVTSRGAITVKIDLDFDRQASETPVLNVDLAASVYTELLQLQKELRLEGTISISDLLSIRDIELFKKPEPPIEQVSETVDTALDRALNAFMTAKIEEGNALRSDIMARHKRLLALLGNIQKLAPSVPIQYKKKMTARIQEYIDDNELDDERISREVALFADRCDISEEITRITSHLGQMEKLMRATEPVGRKLDFIIQELFREINTTGAKANDYGIATLVIDFKAELERIREQVQNIE